MTDSRRQEILKNSRKRFLPTVEIKPTQIQPNLCWGCNQQFVESRGYCVMCYELQHQRQSDWANAFRAGIVAGVSLLACVAVCAVLCAVVYWMFA